MTRRLVCIECPVGCLLTLLTDVRGGSAVSGNKCPKGIGYAYSEIENPVRILTSCVLAEGLSLRMVPVRTDRPIPKAKIMEAMAEVKKARVAHSITAGDVIIENLASTGARLIATRSAESTDIFFVPLFRLCQNPSFRLCEEERKRRRSPSTRLRASS